LLNVSRNPGGRPKWRITAEGVAGLEQLRAPNPPGPPHQGRNDPPRGSRFTKKRAPRVRSTPCVCEAPPASHRTNWPTPSALPTAVNVVDGAAGRSRTEPKVKGNKGK